MGNAICKWKLFQDGKKVKLLSILAVSMTESPAIYYISIIH